MNLKPDIFIFTDGSSRGNPGPGGFGAIVIAPKNHELGIMNYEIREIGGREEHTTNNRMEMRAVIESLCFLKNYQLSTTNYQLTIYTDSSYLINGATKWVHGWQKNGWKTTAKQEVENRDLWESFVAITAIYRKIEWKYVGGHIGIAGNERCDEIATAFADGETPDLYSGILENYRIKNILDIKFDERKKGNKSSKSAHSRAKAYSYVSLVDGVIQIHKTWAECEARVKGKRAKYKKALSPTDEKLVIKELNA